MLINFCINNLYLCLILGGALRLISLLKNSEAAGLQIFGPDNDALQLFRLFSNVISILFSCFAVFELNAYPGMFGLLFVEENQSNVEDIMQNKFTALYLVLPFITVVVNFVVHLYSKKMRRQLQNASSIFVIENAATEQNVEKFTFSVSLVMIIPVFVLITFVQSFADRKQRLFFLSPFHIFMVNVALPMLIIFNNPHIKQFFLKHYIQCNMPLTIKICFSKCFTVRIGPADNPKNIAPSPKEIKIERECNLVIE